MISVIICSRKKNLSEELRSNIVDTIGVPHEIICIDNSRNQYSIFQAYNEGVEKSTFPILCFMHEDIVYHTRGWGKLVAGCFESSHVGMIGVSGPRYISKLPGIWWGVGSNPEDLDSICQYAINTDKNNPQNSYYTYYNPISDKNAVEIAAADGLFFCIRKSLFGQIRFDDVYYSGFHFYDMDIAMQVRTAGYKVLCVYDVLIEHISSSKLDMQWIKSARMFSMKWKSQLPVCVSGISLEKQKRLEMNNFQVMSDILDNNHQKIGSFYTPSEKLYILSFCRCWKVLKRLLF